MSSQISRLQPWFQPWARWLIQDVARHFGARRVTVTSTRRTRAEQNRLYQRYLRGQNPYPVAPPGRSLHESGVALDLVTEPRSVLNQMGAYWRSIGGTWGGASDPIHFDAR